MTLLRNQKPVDVALPFILFRILVAGLIAVHGWARMLAGAIDPFGQFLDGQGLLVGLFLAWAITLLEIVGTILIMVGSRYTSYLSCLFAAIYAAGIAMVHASEGWFVVGLGRNGMEYSVLLISSLLLVAYAHWQKSDKPATETPQKPTDI